MDQRAVVAPALAAAACLAPCMVLAAGPSCGVRTAITASLGRCQQLEPEPEPESTTAAQAVVDCETTLPAAPPRPATDPCLSEEWPVCTPSRPPRFTGDGFVILPRIITADLAARLNTRLERVLRGDFDTGSPPDKRPKFNPETRVKKGKKPQALGGPSKRTLQVINIWKADTTFASVVRSPTLARFVAQLGGWKGARVANDQVWAKPPGAAPITFHRDSTYFDFEPADVITVWLALDDMTEEVGTLEYVVGSHSLVDDAARKEGIDDPSNLLELVMVRVDRGGGSIHNGRLWHGSGANCSKTLPRRGLGIHFVPAEARFRDDTSYIGKLWAPHKQPNSLELPEYAFPATWL